MKVYEAAARAFAAEGTRAVYTMMGDANMYWLNALSSLGVAIYDVRHEGAGLAMADGWGRATGEPGVCSTTGGPGTTQLATTIVVASRARTPLVAFCGDSAAGDVHNAQQYDAGRFAAAVEAGFVRLDDAGRVNAAVREAFRIARHESRPVILSAPEDVQQQTIASGSIYASAGPPPQPPSPDQALVEQSVELLVASERPMILVGRGAVRAGAGAQVAAVAERTGALLATTLLAKNWLNELPFHLGIAGGYGTRTARRLLRESDCLLVAGAGVSSYTSDKGALFAGMPIIQIDTRPPFRYADGRAADVYLRGDAAEVLALLDAELERRGHRATGRRTPDVANEISHSWDDDTAVEIEGDRVDPREACRLLDELIPDDIDLVLGSGQQIRFPTMLMRRQRPLILAQHFFGCIGQGMTTAMGAVMGTGRPAFTIEGDAGLMMHLAELETAVRYRVPLLVVVMNDEGLGAEFHKSVAVGLDPELALIPTPDLGAVAAGMGARGSLARSLDELAAAVRAFVDAPAPTLVDVRISRRVLSVPYRRHYYDEDV